MTIPWWYSRCIFLARSIEKRDRLFMQMVDGERSGNGQLSRVWSLERRERESEPRGFLNYSLVVAGLYLFPETGL